jgi:hypothetical protein
MSLVTDRTGPTNRPRTGTDQEACNILVRHRTPGDIIVGMHRLNTRVDWIGFSHDTSCGGVCTTNFSSRDVVDLGWKHANVYNFNCPRSSPTRRE